jgi:hypothetical protein
MVILMMLIMMMILIMIKIGFMSVALTIKTMMILNDNDIVSDDIMITRMMQTY